MKSKSKQEAKVPPLQKVAPIMNVPPLPTVPLFAVGKRVMGGSLLLSGILCGCSEDIAVTTDQRDVNVSSNMNDIIPPMIPPSEETPPPPFSAGEQRNML